MKITIKLIVKDAENRLKRIGCMVECVQNGGMKNIRRVRKQDNFVRELLEHMLLQHAA